MGGASKCSNNINRSWSLERRDPSNNQLGAGSTVRSNGEARATARLEGVARGTVRHVGGARSEKNGGEAKGFQATSAAEQKR